MNDLLYSTLVDVKQDGNTERYRIKPQVQCGVILLHNACGHTFEKIDYSLIEPLFIGLVRFAMSW